MKIVEFDQFGGPDVLHVVDRPEPAARDGQVLVRIEARSVNAPDAGIRQGLFADWTPQRTFPIVLGADLAGTVLRDSGAFTAGQRVLGMLPWYSLKHVKPKLNAAEQMRAVVRQWKEGVEESKPQVMVK